MFGDDRLSLPSKFMSALECFSQPDQDFKVYFSRQTNTVDNSVICMLYHRLSLPSKFMSALECFSQPNQDFKVQWFLSHTYQWNIYFFPPPYVVSALIPDPLWHSFVSLSKTLLAAHGAGSDVP